MFNAENLKFYFYAQRQPRPRAFPLKNGWESPGDEVGSKIQLIDFFVDFNRLRKTKEESNLQLKILQDWTN